MHPPNDYFLPLFLSVCVYLNGEYSGLYPYKSFPILFPLVRSPHISYQALSSNSLDLPYCRSLSPLFTLAPFSFLSFVFFFLFQLSTTPFSQFYLLFSSSACFCTASVLPSLQVHFIIGETGTEGRGKIEES